MQAIPITTDIAQQVAWLREFALEACSSIRPTSTRSPGIARRHGIALPSLRLIHPIGKTASPRLRQEAELSARIADKYSSQEAGIIAAECLGLYHTMAEGRGLSTSAPGHIKSVAGAGRPTIRTAKLNA